MTAPSSSKCEVSIRNSLEMAPATGATGTLTVTTTRDCAWDAASSSPWIVITAGSSGQGEGNISYRVTANEDPAPRRGTVSVNETQLSVAQEPAPCRFAVSPLSGTVVNEGGSVSVRVETAAVCEWTVLSDASWITSDVRGSKTGTATFNLLVAENPGQARSGSARVGGRT